MKKSKLNFLFILVVVFLIFFPIHITTAQKMHMQDGIVFEQYNMDFGLSSNGIVSMIKDSNGFLWLGTADGLNVFDGKNIKVYKGYLHENTAFKGKKITSLLEDSNNNILCGTEEYGINILNRKSGIFINSNESLFDSGTSKAIKSIAEIGSYHYAILTTTEIIYFKLDKDFKAYDISRTLITLHKKEYTRKLLFFENILYLNTSNRLIAVTPNNFKTILSYQYLKDCKIRNNKLWLNVDESIGFLSKNKSDVTWVNYKFENNIDDVNDYYLDFDVTSTNQLWIGTKLKLIHLTLNDHYEVKESQEIYNSNGEVYKVLIDDLQNIYLAVARNHGLLKIDGRQQQYNYIKLPKGYENEYRHSFAEDNNGMYWIGGNTGLFAYNTKTKSYHKFNNNSYKGLPDLKINHLIKDKLGKIWIGTSNGIAEFNEKENSFNFYTANFENKWDSFIYDLKIDLNQDLWYVTKNRLNYLNHKTKTHKYYEIENLGAIFIDSTNTMWAGVRGVGLVKYNIDSEAPKREREYLLSKEFPKGDIHNIIDDKYGRLWINNSNGIYVFDPNKDKILFLANRNNVLKHESLYEITPDNRGNFWVSQYNFPSVCISSKTFEIVEKSPVWMRQENEIDRYAGPKTIEKNGKIFCEGRGGFFVYHTDSLKVNATPPKVVLHNLKLNGSVEFENFLGIKSLNFRELNYYENTIEVGLKSINPETSYTTEYAYRLLGNTDNWNYSKELENINFSGLRPNDYQLQIKSTNNGMDWSSPITLVSFQIFPPWWQTKYAFMAYLVLVILLFYAFYKLQLNRKLAESEALKFKEVDDFKNVFYQNITHEFRTPLTVILGLTESLKDKTSTTIKRNARQLLKLVNELLEIGQIESNSVHLEMKTQDVVSFTKYCLESFESLAHEKEISLSFKANKEYLPVNYDSDKYQIVLNNVLSNAIKFTPLKGEISIDIEEVSQQVIIKIRDNGPGIANKDFENIFNRYYQSDSSLKSKGNGIGLALTKELVKLMNGNISAANNVEGGAYFTLTFPLVELTAFSQTSNQRIEISTKETLDENEKVILVIEDNKDVMEYIVSILPNSYKIITAIDGKQGVEKALELIPDIIISDVMMPFKDGYEVCDTLKSDEKTNHIPIVLLTAKADMQSKIAGIIKGADAYLGKPFNKAELLAQLNNLIRLREKLKAKYSSEINELYTGNRKLTDVFLNKLQNLVLKKIDDENYGINKICSDLGISRTQLHRKIKAITGVSASIFIREIRLTEGYKILLNSDFTVSEVAYAVGFSDLSYFTKLFTKKYGKTPSSIKNN